MRLEVETIQAELERHVRVEAVINERRVMHLRRRSDQRRRVALQG